MSTEYVFSIIAREGLDFRYVFAMATASEPLRAILNSMDAVRVMVEVLECALENDEITEYPPSVLTPLLTKGYNGSDANNGQHIALDDETISYFRRHLGVIRAYIQIRYWELSKFRENPVTNAMVLSQ